MKNTLYFTTNPIYSSNKMTEINKFDITESVVDWICF